MWDLGGRVSPVHDLAPGATHVLWDRRSLRPLPFSVKQSPLESATGVQFNRGSRPKLPAVNRTWGPRLIHEGPVGQ